MDKILRLGLDPTGTEQGAQRYSAALNQAGSSVKNLAAAEAAAAASRLDLNSAYAAAAKLLQDEAAASERSRAALRAQNAALDAAYAAKQRQIQVEKAAAAQAVTTAANTSATGVAAIASSVGFSRLNREVITLTQRALGANPVLGQTVYVLSQMAGGGGVMLAVATAAAVAAGAWAVMTSEAHKLRQEADSLVESLDKAARTRAAGGAELQIKAIRDQLASQIEFEHKGMGLGLVLGPAYQATVGAYFAARLYIDKKAYEAYNKAIAEQETQAQLAQEKAAGEARGKNAGAGLTDQNELARQRALARTYDENGVALARVNVQYDLQAAIIKNHIELTQHLTDGTFAEALAEERRANAVARSSAAIRQLSLDQKELNAKIARVMATDTGAAGTHTTTSVDPYGRAYTYTAGGLNPQAGRSYSYDYHTGQTSNTQVAGMDVMRSYGALDSLSAEAAAYSAGRPQYGDYSFLQHLKANAQAQWNTKGGLAGAGKAGGMALGLGLATSGALGGTVADVANQAMALGSLGAQIGGPIGAVVGAVGGMVKGFIEHGKKAREAAELLKQAQGAFDADVAARRAMVQGQSEQAAIIRQQAAAEKELAEARKNKMSETSIAALKEVQAEEALASARDRQTAEAQKLIAAEEELWRKRQEQIQAQDDLSIRYMKATGLDTRTQELAVRHNAELAAAEHDATKSASDIAYLKYVQKAEDLALAQLIAQEKAQAEAQKQTEILSDQLHIAEDALRVHEQAYREAQQIADNLKDYSDSLKTGQYSPASPIDQLNSARTQFQMLYQLAKGGDSTAASSLSGSASTLLGQSRSYYNSSLGYVQDFNTVQADIDEIQKQFAGRASIEQQIYLELQYQTLQLQYQIDLLNRTARATESTASSTGARPYDPGTDGTEGPGFLPTDPRSPYYTPPVESSTGAKTFDGGVTLIVAAVQEVGRKIERLNV